MGVTIVNSGVRQEKGITYSEITDSSADWGDVTDGAYFYDIATDLPYYKSSGGLILSLFSEANTLYTSNGTLTGDRTIDQGSHTLTFNGDDAGGITSSFNGRTAFISNRTATASNILEVQNEATNKIFEVRQGGNVIINAQGSAGDSTFSIYDNDDAKIIDFSENGKVNFSGLPTNAAGLSAGDLWDDSGIVRIGTTVPADDESLYTIDSTIGSGRVATITDTLTFEGGNIINSINNSSTNEADAGSYPLVLKNTELRADNIVGMLFQDNSVNNQARIYTRFGTKNSLNFDIRDGNFQNAFNYTDNSLNVFNSLSGDADGNESLTIEGQHLSAVVGSGARIGFKQTDSDTYAAYIKSYTFGAGNTGLGFATGFGSSPTVKMTIDGDGIVNMSNLPTASTGLGAGDLWSDNGDVRIGTTVPSGSNTIYTADGTLTGNRTVDLDGNDLTLDTGVNGTIIVDGADNTNQDLLQLNGGTNFFGTGAVTVGTYGNVEVKGTNSSGNFKVLTMLGNEYFTLDGNGVQSTLRTKSFDIGTNSTTGYKIANDSGTHQFIRGGIVGAYFNLVSSSINFWESGMTSRKFIVGASGLVGTEQISLQGSTLIKGNGTSTGSALSIYDNDTTPTKLWDFLDNGTIQKGDTIINIGNSNSTTGSVTTYAIGWNNSITGGTYGKLAIGDSNSVNGTNAYTFGRYNVISANNIFQFGNYLQSGAQGAFIIGHGDYSDSANKLVNNTASSLALGWNTTTPQHLIKSTGAEFGGTTELTSTEDGFLMNRLTTLQRDSISTPTEHLLIFNVDNDRIERWNGTIWVAETGVDTLYSANGTLTGDRTVDLGSNTLTIENSGASSNFQINSSEDGYSLFNRSGGLKVRPGGSGNDPIVVTNTTDTLDTFTVKKNGGGSWSAYNGVKIGELTTNDFAQFTIDDLNFYKANVLQHKIGFGVNTSDVDFWVNGVSANNSFRVGGGTLIGTEAISLQGSTAIKGTGTSTGSALAIYDNDTTPNKLWDFLDNGDLTKGDTILNVGNSNVITGSGTHRFIYGTGNDINGTSKIWQFAIGVDNELSGSNQGAFGRLNTTTGLGTQYAFGSKNQLNGSYAFAVGGDNVSTKNFTFNLGMATSSTAIGAFVIGYGDSTNFANKLVNNTGNSLALGWDTTTPQHLIKSTGAEFGGTTELTSTEDGFLMNRLTTVERDLITAPADHLLIFNTDNERIERFDGTVWVAETGGSTIYTADGTLTGDRVVDLDGNKLNFDGGQTYIDSGNVNPLVINRKASGTLGNGIDFNAYNASNLEYNFARIIQVATDVSTNNEDGGLWLRVSDGGTMTTKMEINSDTIKFNSIPSTDTGITSGEIWQDNGYLRINSATGTGITFYEVDGTLGEDRTVNLNGNGLTFEGGQTRIDSGNFNPLILNRKASGVTGVGFDLNAYNSSNVEHNFARIVQVATDVTAGSEDGSLWLRVSDNGTITTKVEIKTTGVDLIGTTELSSTDGGLLMNRLTNIQRNSISTPEDHLLIFNTDNARIERFDGTNWVGETGNNLYTEDGTLTEDRILDLGNSNTLTIENSGASSNLQINAGEGGYSLFNRSGGLKVVPSAAGNDSLVCRNTIDTVDVFNVEKAGGGYWSANGGVNIGADDGVTDFANFSIEALNFYANGSLKHQIGFKDANDDVFFHVNGSLPGRYFIIGSQTPISNEAISLQGSTAIKGNGVGTDTALAIYNDATTPAKVFEVLDNGTIKTEGNVGFTGTGNYTNFTIVNGIITAAS